MIKHLCPQCSKLLKAPDDLAGQKIKCPHCEARSFLPTLDPDPVVASDEAGPGKFLGMEPVKNETVDESYLTGGETYVGDEAFEGQDYKKGGMEQGTKLIIAGLGSMVLILVAILIFSGDAESNVDEEPIATAKDLSEELTTNEEVKQATPVVVKPVEPVEVQVVEKPKKPEVPKSAPNISFPSIETATSTNMLYTLAESGKSNTLSARNYGGTFFVLFKFKERISDYKQLKSAVLTSNRVDYLPTLFGVNVGQNTATTRKNPSGFEEMKFIQPNETNDVGIDAVIYVVSGSGSGVGYFHYPNIDESTKSDMIQWKYFRSTYHPTTSYRSSHQSGSTMVSVPTVASAEVVSCLNGPDYSGRMREFGSESRPYSYVVITFKDPVKDYTQLMSMFLMQTRKQGSTTSYSTLSHRCTLIGIETGDTYLKHPDKLAHVSFQTPNSRSPKEVRAIAFPISRSYTGLAVLKPSRVSRYTKMNSFMISPNTSQNRVKKIPSNTSKSSILTYNKKPVAIKGKHSLTGVSSVPRTSGSSNAESANLQLMSGGLSIKGLDEALSVSAENIIGVSSGNDLVYYSSIRKCFYIYSINKKGVDQTIKVPDASAKAAIGGKHLVVYMKNANVFYVYDIDSGDRKASFKNPFDGPISNIIMGKNNDNACVVMYYGKDRSGYYAQINNLMGSPYTSSPLKSKKLSSSYFQEKSSSKVNARSNGDLSKILVSNGYSYFYQLSQNRSGAWNEDSFRVSGTLRVMVPHGRYNVGIHGYVYGSGESEVFKTGGDYLIPIDGIDGFLRYNVKSKKLSIQQMGNSIPVADLGAIPWLDAKYTSSSGLNDFDRRIIYDIKKGDLLIVHPQGKRILHAHCPLSEVFKGKDYVFPLLGSGVDKAVKGATWNYAVKALSKNGEFKLSAVTLPEGMKIHNNELSWQVPHSAGEAIDVVLKVTSGRASTELNFQLTPTIKTTIIEAQLPKDLQD